LAVASPIVVWLLGYGVWWAGLSFVVWPRRGR
jgi:hypothetical protein